MTAIDPLQGIQLDGASVIRAGVSRPELHILKGDKLIVRPCDDAPVGAVVVVKDLEDHEARLRRWTGEAGFEVAGMVVGVVRNVTAGEWPS